MAMVTSKNSRDSTKKRVWYWVPRGMGHDPSPAVTSSNLKQLSNLSETWSSLLLICSCVRSEDFCEAPYWMPNPAGVEKLGSSLSQSCWTRECAVKLIEQAFSTYLLEWRPRVPKGHFNCSWFISKEALIKWDKIWAVGKSVGKGIMGFLLYQS